MLDQFNEFMDALDQQINFLDKEMAELEAKKQNLVRAREQFVETSRLLNQTEENEDIVIKPEVESVEPVQEESSKFNYEESPVSEVVETPEVVDTPEVVQTTEVVEETNTTNYMEETMVNNYEEVMPEVTYEEQLNIAPVEDTSFTPVEVYDNNDFAQVSEENPLLSNYNE